MAWFKRASGGDSRTGDRGAENSYAAPEIIQGSVGRKYDVWSLGCILLELLVFVVDGYKGVSKLDDALTESTEHGECKRFFLKDPQEPFTRLKPQVKKTTADLLSRARDPHHVSPTDLPFLKQMVDIINDMLTVDVTSRIDSTAVVQRIESVFPPAPQTPGPVRSTLTHPGKGEIEVQLSQSIPDSIAKLRYVPADSFPSLSLTTHSGLYGRSLTDLSSQDLKLTLQVFEKSDSGRLRFVTTSYFTSEVKEHDRM